MQVRGLAGACNLGTDTRCRCVGVSWDPYPMNVAANQNAVVWIDVTIPSTQQAGTYSGSVNVASGGQRLASLPIELEIGGATLPDWPVKTMLFYDRSELDQKIGGGDAVEQNLWQLYHRHRISPMHSVMSASDVQSHLPALDGSQYTAAKGYEGPGEGLGDGILSLGSYGGYGAPSASALAQVEGVADVLATNHLFPTTDVFVYAADESCNSSDGLGWKSLLAGSADANASSVKVGWTCSSDPTQQKVDIPIVMADSFDVASATAARAMGKNVWIYNGVRPQTDAFLTDTSAVALRANGWISALADTGRWFYWETTFWYDNNPGGHGAYDPFTTGETFHNSGGDWCDGDGVLVYPGKQVDMFTNHSIGMNGVLASIRLKNMRRGIEDAGYYQLAHAASATSAEGIGKNLLPNVLSGAQDGAPVAWSESGAPWFAARKALYDLVPKSAGGGGSASDAGGSGGGGAGSGGDEGGGGGGGGHGATDAGALAGGDASSGGAAGAAGAEDWPGNGASAGSCALAQGAQGTVVTGHSDPSKSANLGVAVAAK